MRVEDDLGPEAEVRSGGEEEGRMVEQDDGGGDAADRLQFWDVRVADFQRGKFSIGKPSRMKLLCV